MQARVCRLQLLQHDSCFFVSTNRFVSEIASQASQPLNEQQQNSIPIKAADKPKREWIRFSHKINIHQQWIRSMDETNPNPDNRKSVAPLIDVGSLILFEDNHLLVLLKPNNTLVQGDLGGADNLLDAAKEFLVQRDKKRGEAFLGLVHRIDRPCSGVIVFAKTSKAAARISESFRRRKVVKEYLCVVNGQLTGNGRCDHLVLPVQNDKTFVFDSLSVAPKGRHGMVEAGLRYEAVHSMERLKVNFAPVEGEVQSQESSLVDDQSQSQLEPSMQTLVRVLLETGRKHQIRAQLAHIGHPIVGDVKYGAPQAFKTKDIALHAYALTVAHPITSVEMRFTAPPPQSWLKRFGAPAIEAAKALLLQPTEKK